MLPEEIIFLLRHQPGYENPIDKIELFKKLMDGKPTQFDFIRYFKQSFPNVPLRVWIDVSANSRLFPKGGINDDEVMFLLADWLPLQSPEPGIFSNA